MESKNNILLQIRANTFKKQQIAVSVANVSDLSFTRHKNTYLQ